MYLWLNPAFALHSRSPKALTSTLYIDPPYVFNEFVGARQQHSSSMFPFEKLRPSHQLCSVCISVT